MSVSVSLCSYGERNCRQRNKRPYREDWQSKIQYWTYYNLKICPLMCWGFILNKYPQNEMISYIPFSTLLPHQINSCIEKMIFFFKLNKFLPFAKKKSSQFYRIDWLTTYFESRIAESSRPILSSIHRWDIIIASAKVSPT